MAEMKTFNGYDVVDAKAQKHIEETKTEDNYKILRSSQGRWFPVYPSMMAQSNKWYKSTYPKANITSITFIANPYTPDGTEDENWNCDHDNLGLVKCYRKGSTLVIAGNGYKKISANMNCSAMFRDFTSLAEINGLNILDTGSVVTMSNMFVNCKALKNLDLSSWDTSNVTNMSTIFAYCEGLETLNVSGWNTSKVTNMNGAFSVGHRSDTTGTPVASLTSIIGIEDFDTSNVETMDSIFYGATVEDLPVSSWDVSKVKNAGHAFCRCYNLSNESAQKIIDNWNLENCEAVSSMFTSCYALTSLSVGGFIKPSWRIIQGLFASCINLVNITGLDEWDTSHIKSMEYLFRDCESIKELNLNNWNTQSLEECLDERNEIAYAMVGFFNNMIFLEKITLGANFVFKDNVTLPTPNSEYITGATGKWKVYDSNGNHVNTYTPEELANYKNDTFQRIRCVAEIA